MRIGEPAKDKVHFADTAMPASKKKTTATRIQPLARQVRPCGHRMSPTPKTRTGPGGVSYRGLVPQCQLSLCTGLHCTEIPHKPACAHATARAQSSVCFAQKPNGRRAKA